MCKDSLCKPKVEKLIGWRRPKNGYVKLNIDDATKCNPRRARARGVIHDKGCK